MEKSLSHNIRKNSQTALQVQTRKDNINTRMPVSITPKLAAKTLWVISFVFLFLFFLFKELFKIVLMSDKIACYTKHYLDQRAYQPVNLWVVADF